MVIVFASRDAIANHVPNTSSAWLIDADPTGNTATTLGSREACITATPDSDVTVDITVLDVPPVDTHGTEEPEDDTGGIIGFHFELQFPTGLSIEAADSEFLLGENPASNLFADYQFLPDSDGLFVTDVADLGPGPDVTEAGDGVLTRLTIHVSAGAAPGSYDLLLVGSAGAVHYDSHADSLVAPVAYSAQIAVGVPCAGPDIMGDIDCSGGVSAVDALKVLRHGASLSVAQTEPCNDPGSQSPPVGDVDCSGATNAVDALKVLRFGASLGYAKVHLCDDIGS
jgi:hypothetical protein